LTGSVVLVTTMMVKRIVAQRLVQRHVGGDRAKAPADQRITVGRRLCPGGSSGIAAGTRAVVDDDGPPHRLRHLVEHDAADHVAGAATRKRHDIGDRPRRIFLRNGDACKSKAGERKQRAGCNADYNVHIRIAFEKSLECAVSYRKGSL
jgi:hypothetical protein